jgi:hypothetical protein
MDPAIQRCRDEQKAARHALELDPASRDLRRWLSDWLSEEILITPAIHSEARTGG